MEEEHLLDLKPFRLDEKREGRVVGGITGTFVEGIKEEVVLSPVHALSLIAAGEVRFYIENGEPHNLPKIEDLSSPQTTTTPPTPEPPDQTSDPGFKLFGLFEETADETRFISSEPVPTIISKPEEMQNWRTSPYARKKDCQVSLEDNWEGEKKQRYLSLLHCW
ncbi:CBL-interacting protein kinase 19 [Platanthera guangdongensis]|uniref:CBL-interacting protein kinase 19 n=1 Tax=Platanthera guangdongensis TaxID=2320717 RepID=A0ABR2N2I3_9ASPA